MYEMVILAFLMRRPMHGYLIAKIINDMIGPYARLSNGRLYPLMSKLEADGLIAVAGEPGQLVDRRQRAYQITDAGRRRFHQLMMDTTSNPGDYQRIFWHKVPFLEFLEPAERLYLLEHYINFCQTHLFHVREESDDLARKAQQQGQAGSAMTAAQLDATLYVMRHLQHQWELQRRDAEGWREREVASQQASQTAGTPTANGAAAIEEPSR